MRLPHLNLSKHELGAVTISVMAVGGLVGVIGVLLGLQCGGLDKCFFHEAEDMVAAVEPAEAAPAPRLEQARLVSEPLAIAGTADAGGAEAAGIEQVIGGSFAALNANDEAWLASARKAAAAQPAVTAVAATKDDAAAPIGDGETAAQAVAAVAETPVVPLDRPEPLEVSAYARTPATAPEVKDDAQQRLAAAAETGPTKPQTSKAEPVQVAEAEVPAAAGDIRTVGGTGVNVRSGPGKSNGRLFALAAGEKVKVLQDQGGWLKVTDDQNRTGWVYQSYLR